MRMAPLQLLLSRCIFKLLQPKRSRAVLWCNVLANGEPDARVIHE